MVVSMLQHQKEKIMNPRSVKRIVLGQDVQMGPILLKQPLPQGNIDQVDPFLLIHHVGPRNTGSSWQE